MFQLVLNNSLIFKHFGSLRIPNVRFLKKYKYFIIMKVSPNFKLDPDKKLSDLAREFAELNGLAGGQFMYKGKFLPGHQTLRELNIDPTDVITFMGMGVGPKPE